jgi:aryl-alcohol dehydrogenase-like predicted oxidoreductase
VAVGLSNVTIAQLDAALAVGPVTSVQNRLSYGDPRDLPTALACARRNVAYLAYSPFGGPSGTPPGPALAVARRRGVSVHRVVLAWLRAQSPNIVPLAGASRPASIRDSAALLDLSDQDLEDLRAGKDGRTRRGNHAGR